MAQQKKTGGLGRGLGALISGAMVRSAQDAAFTAPKKTAGTKKEPKAPEPKTPKKAGTKPKAVPAQKPETKKTAGAKTAAGTPKKAGPKPKAVPAQKAAPAQKAVPAQKPNAPKKAEPAAAAAKAVPAEAKPAPLPYREIAVAKVVPAPHQSRKNFDEAAMNELADSIRAEGLLQPIVVREIADGKFELIAGERRWRAFQMLKLPLIPARVVKASNASSAAMTLIENLQRADLNPIEEAFGLGSLLRDFNLTQDAVAERVGKARSSVANALRLLALDKEIQGLVSTGILSVGHAKVLLGVADEAQRLLLARRLAEMQCSVRVAEELARRVNAGKSPVPAANAEPVIRKISEEIFRIEKLLCSHLRTKVLVKNGEKSGKILIEYHGNEDLRRLLEIFGLTDAL